MKLIIDIPDEMYHKIRLANIYMTGMRSCKTLIYILIRAIQAGVPLVDTEKDDKWIKTSDQTPDEYQEVLVTCEDGYMDKAEFCGSYWMLSGEYYYEKYDIPAWQPLPEPYSEESDKE